MADAVVDLAAELIDIQAARASQPGIADVAVIWAKDDGGQIRGFLIPCDTRGFATREIERKVSLRATDGTVDVSKIARSLGGGGHRQAAGASSDLSVEQIVSLLRDQVAQQLDQ